MPEEIATLNAEETAITSPQPEAPAAPEEAPIEGEPEGDRTPHFVPAGEVARERNRRRQIETERDQARADFQKLAGRLETMQELFTRGQQQQEQPRPLPPLEQEPLAHIEAQARRQETIEQQLARFEQERQQQFRAAELNQQRGYFLSRIQDSEDTYRQSAPDYNDAIDHLRDGWRKQLTRTGMKPAMVEKVMIDQALAMADIAIQNGQDPAAIYYGMAQDAGYKPKGNGARLETIERGQRSGRSLSQPAGAAPPGQLSAQALVNMSDAEFTKLSYDDFKKAMGG